MRTEGFLIQVSRSGGESCNCNSGDYGDDEIDYHFALAAAGDTFDEALVTEVTPQVRAVHPAWALDNLGALLFEELPVRVSGWLLLDTEHPDHVGRLRGTRWEIHPVLGIEVLRDGERIDYDAIAPVVVPSDDEERTPPAEP